LPGCALAGRRFSPPRWNDIAGVSARECGPMVAAAGKPIVQRMREDALRLFREAIQAADPQECVRRHLRLSDGILQAGQASFRLADFHRIVVVGAGKASAPMAKAVEALLGERISSGAILVKQGHGLPLDRIQVLEAGHPIPDERGVEGTARIRFLTEAAGEGDLVICLLSGGGSSLLVSPAEPVTLGDKQELTQILMECGATVHEINAVRKHLSRLKGGGLTRCAHPAHVLTLVLSDVVGDDLDVIASGPTVPDRSTFRDVAAVFSRYGIWERLPPSVARRARGGLRGEVPETPKPGDPLFDRSHVELVGTNLASLEAAKRAAGSMGYRTLILSAAMEGDTAEVARMHAAVAKEILRSGNPLPPPACILSGGETTVTLHGAGKGGRNQEFVLAAALAIRGLEHVAILSGGTDGTDGPTDAAGAVADGRTISRAQDRGMDAEDHLRRNDSYPFFRELGDLVITGPTRTNVMDIHIVLVERP